MYLVVQKLSNSHVNIKVEIKNFTGFSELIIFHWNFAYLLI